ncbi:hypothetical protein [Micromonospora sp. RV43]|uniref:hypothetical protein n=1 Tax=Micromonospora sp. RV43 TaxID=1661387 RepID=UPI00064C1FEA|nr:hypothetical protein [Micromonospora sp. RV43]
MAEYRHDEDLVRIVADAFTAQTRRAAPDPRNLYSSRRLAALSSDDTAVAVLDALARAGRLASRRNLENFGIRFLLLGLGISGAIGLIAVFTDWPPSAVVAIGVAGGVAGARSVNRAAARGLSGAGRGRGRG